MVVVLAAATLLRARGSASPAITKWCVYLVECEIIIGTLLRNKIDLIIPLVVLVRNSYSRFALLGTP